MTEKKHNRAAEPWYVTERMHARAIILLTERDDLIRTAAPAGSGLDFVVDVTKKGRVTGRRFGLVLMPLQGEERLRHVKPVTSLPYPVCLFAFDVVSDDARYSWFLEPVISDEHEAKLAEHRTIEFQKLDRKSLNQIIDRINRWYDALLGSIVTANGK